MHSNKPASLRVTPSISLGMRSTRPARWTIAVGRMLLGTLLASNLVTAYAQTARIPIADPNAPLAFRPSVSTLPSGAALVNITTPNAAGMSLNQFQRFDAPTAGVVLNNNNRAGGSALLGSGVGVNPNLSNGTASTIVNEVTVQGAPSQLNGTIEVFGAPAAVIVANPNGITCSGCGMVNTPRLTFATGAPQLQAADGTTATWANASRLAWDIKGGQIRILDSGIEGTVGRLDLLGQSLLIDGPLRAHYLNQDLSSINLAAGTQGFALQADGNWGPGPTVSPGAPAPAPNGIAIDATVLGAMTAGQIRIVSTDAGMGVNMRGPLNAFQQGVQANSNGALSLGQVAAVQGIQLSANGQLTTGKLSAGTTIDATSAGSMALGGRTTAGGDIKLQSGGDLSTGANLATPGNLVANARGRLGVGQQGGQISIGNSAQLSGGTVVQEGKLDVGSDLTVSGGGDVHLAGEIHTGRDVSVQAGGTAMVSGTLSASRDFVMAAGDIAMLGNLQVGNNATLGAARSLTLAGNATVGNDLSLSGSPLSVSGTINARNTSITGDSIVLGAGGSTASITGGLALNMARSIDVNGPLNVVGNAYLASGTDTHINGAVNVTGAFAVNAGGDATVGAGAVQAGSVQMRGTNVSVAGDILSGTTISLDGANAVKVQGLLGGAGDVSAKAGADLQIDGMVVSGGNLSLNGASVTTAGQLHSQGATSITAQSGAVSVQGTVNSGGDLTMAGSQVSVNGQVTTLGAANITSRTGDVSIQGDMVANQALTLNSAGAATINGRVASGGATNIAAVSSLTLNGELASAGATTLQTGGNLNVGGALRSGGPLQANAAGAINVQGQALVVGDATVTSGGAQTWGGPLVTTGKLQASNAAGDFTVAGGVSANGPVTITSAGAITSAGLASGGQAQLVAGNDIAINGAAQVQGGTFKSSQGAVRIGGNVDSQQALTLAAQTDTIVSGKTTVGGDLTATGTTGTVRFAQDLAVGGNLTAHAGQDLQLQGSANRVLGSATLSADAGTTSTSSAGGSFTAGNGLAIHQTGDYVNEGTVQVNGDLAIQARNIKSNLANAGGITTTGKLDLAATQKINLGAQGVVTSKGDTTMSAMLGATNAGQLNSGGTLTYSGGTLANATSGSIAATSVAINADLNNDGSVWGDAAVSARKTISTGSIGTNSSTGTASFATLNNSGTISGAGIGAGVTSNTGTIVSTGNIGIVDGLDNFGVLSAQGEVSFTSGQAYNSGQINGNTVVIGTTKLTNVGVIQSDGSTFIYGGALDNLATGQINAGTTLKFDMSGDGANRGKITSGQGMDLQFAGALTNTKDNPAAQGVIASGGAMTVKAASLANDGGTLQAAGTLTVQSSGAISNGTAAGTAGSVRGTQVTLNGTDVRNEGLIQATSDPVTINASGAFSNTGGNAAVDAPSTLTITAKSIDNGAGAKLQAAQDITLTATAGGVSNAGTIYGPGGAPANITINATGGGFANTGTTIAGSKLNITGSGYTNSGTVGSLGDAKLATGAYDPDNAIIALGTLDIGSGFTIGVGKGWSSAAATTRWSGKITNYGSLYLKGTGVGDVDNLSSGVTLLSGTPATTTAYEVRDWSPPPGMTNATIVGYTDVANRAQFVAGGLSGTLVNRASDASTTGAGYDPQEVKQSIVWGGTVWDADQNKDVYREVGVANAAASTARLIVPSGGSITLAGPNTGTIIGTDYTIKGADLTLGQSMDGASSQLAMTGARERTVTPGSTPQAQVLTPLIGRVGGPNGVLSTAPDLQLPSAAGLAAANQPGHLNTVAPNLTTAQGAVDWLTTGVWTTNGASPVGQGAPQFPNWNSYTGTANTVNADSLTLELTGKFTNRGYFAVKDDLTINAAKGIDNGGAALKAGGSIGLFGGDLNNRGGSIESESFFANLDGDVQSERGRIQVQRDLELYADGDVNLQGGSATSQGGDLVLDAGGTLRLKGEQSQGGTATVAAAAGQMTLRSGQDLDVASMTIAADKGVTLGAGGSIQANQANIQSAAGQVSMEAGADINLQAAIVKGARGVSLTAGGNVNLDAIEERSSSTTQSVTSHTVMSAEPPNALNDHVHAIDVRQKCGGDVDADHGEEALLLPCTQVAHRLAHHPSIQRARIPCCFQFADERRTDYRAVGPLQSKQAFELTHHARADLDLGLVPKAKRASVQKVDRLQYAGVDLQSLLVLDRITHLRRVRDVVQGPGIIGEQLFEPVRDRILFLECQERIVDPGSNQKHQDLQRDR